MTRGGYGAGVIVTQFFLGLAESYLEEEEYQSRKGMPRDGRHMMANAPQSSCNANKTAATQRKQNTCYTNKTAATQCKQSYNPFYVGMFSFISSNSFFLFSKHAELLNMKYIPLYSSKRNLPCL